MFYPVRFCYKQLFSKAIFYAVHILFFLSTFQIIYNKSVDANEALFWHKYMYNKQEKNKDRYTDGRTNVGIMI